MSAYLTPVQDSCIIIILLVIAGLFILSWIYRRKKLFRSWERPDKSTITWSMESHREKLYYQQWQAVGVLAIKLLVIAALVNFFWRDAHGLPASPAGRPGNSAGPLFQELRDSLAAVNSTLREQKSVLAAALLRDHRIDSLSPERIAAVARPAVNRIGILSSVLKGICAVLVLVALFNRKKAKPILATAAATALLDLAMDIKFDVKPEFKFDFKPEIKICNCDTGRRPEVIVTDTVKTIKLGPFVAGYDNLQPAAADSSVRVLYRFLRDSTITDIDLYGGVDQRPLKGKAKARFGDNLTLAQARCNAVRDKIIAWYKAKGIFKQPLINARPIGAEFTSDSTQQEGFYEQSRYVTVIGKSRRQTVRGK